MKLCWWSNFRRNKAKVDGYTFNPSIYKSLGAEDYLKFSDKISKEIKLKPISIEVIGDSHEECFRQAKILDKIADNIWVKIPISYTNGKSTKKLINDLVNDGIKLNITAIFTIEQIKEIIDITRDSNCILSIFSGRLYDIGQNTGLNLMKWHILFIKIQIVNLCGLAAEWLMITLLQITMQT